MTNIGIVIPTYNEVENITLLFDSIKRVMAKLDKSVKFIIVVVDDKSPDKTSNIAKDYAKKNSKPGFIIKVIDRKLREGYGKACVQGILYLLGENVDWVIQMDADLSHNPIYLPAFIEASKNSDFIVGSRYIKGGDTPDWQIYRKIISRYGNIYARLILGSGVSDYTGGYNMYSSSLIKKINLNYINSTGYGFLIELKFEALRNTKSVSEIPIIFSDRKHGKSKLPKSTILKNFILVPRIRINKL